MQGRVATLAGIAVVLLALPVSSAAAATITVNDNGTAFANDGKCTLPEAISAANNDVASGGASGECIAGNGADTINFSGVSGTITLSATLPHIITPIDIQGPGAGQLTVSGADSVGIFALSNASGPVTISGLTIAHGMCTGGCAFFNGGSGVGSQNSTLTLTDDVFANNAAATGIAPGGAAVLSVGSGSLTVSRSTFRNNSATASGASDQTASGGAVYGGGTVNIDQSTFDNNTVTATTAGGNFAHANGAAIASDGALTVTRSTFVDNTISAAGGASGNTARGGAIFTFFDPGVVHLTIDRSTFTGNASTAGAPGAVSEGGAIDNQTADALQLTSSTLTGNSAATGANLANSGADTVKNTIMSSPLVGTSCAGPVASGGYNIEGGGSSCGFNQSTDKPNTDPMLDPAGLANNGGPTKTIGLQAGSPAIDQGLSSAGESTDQRLLSRPSDFGAIANAPGGDGTDIGAFEAQDTVPPDTTIDSGPTDGSLINNTSPSFGFSATEPGSTFQCSVDNGPFADCSSPRGIGPLTDGQHTFAVKAIDVAHNADPSPAARSFVVDATPPDTSIASGPADGSLTNNSSPSFAFNSDDAAATFECSLDGGAFGACSTPDQLGPLTDGRHTFAVRAVDAAANADPSPASHTFTVDTTAPETTLVKPPKAKTKHRKLKLRFRSSEPGSTFQCQVDKTPFRACTSPFTTPKLKFKVHVFKVRAVDPAGNADPTVAKVRFRVLRQRHGHH